MWAPSPLTAWTFHAFLHLQPRAHSATCFQRVPGSLAEPRPGHVMQILLPPVKTHSLVSLGAMYFCGPEGHGCALFHSNAQALRAVQGRERSCQGPRRCATTVILGDSAGWCAEQGGPRACGRAAQSDAVRCWGCGPHGWASPSPGPGVTRPRQHFLEETASPGGCVLGAPQQVPTPPTGPPASPLARILAPSGDPCPFITAAPGAPAAGFWRL